MGVAWTEFPDVVEACDLAYAMWQLGWDEANGGNISCLLTDDEVDRLGYVEGTGRSMPLVGIPDSLRGRELMITASGSYMRSLRDDPEHLLGIVHIPREGDHYEIAAGLKDSKPTFDLAVHLAVHDVRLARDESHRVVMHNHPPALTAMTLAIGPHGKRLTVELWRVLTEAVMFFPAGIGVTAWHPVGRDGIVAESLEKMHDHKLVLWPYHGSLTCGSSVRAAFGLLETAEKCADMWLRAEAAGGAKFGIPDDGLRESAEVFGVKLADGYL